MANEFVHPALSEQQLAHLVDLVDKQVMAAAKLAQNMEEVADRTGLRVEVLRKYVAAIYKGDKAVASLKRSTEVLGELLENERLTKLAEG